MSNYWEKVRAQYAAFESGLSAPASEVYLHEMPGGQFTNLKAQARSLGLEDRWHEVAQTYADVNQMFGDIVKVTPSSKVVGDMALMMVAQGLTRAQVEDPDVDVAFPEFGRRHAASGNLGQPPGGWPAGILKKVLKGETPLTDRPGKHLPPVDLEATRAKLAEDLRLGDEEAEGETVDDEDLNGYLMYPKVFMDYRVRHRLYGPVRVAADPDLLLRHGAGRRDHRRDRPRQDAGNPPASRGRDDRRRRGPGVLRIERPAPRDPRAEPRGQGQDRRQAKGAGRQPGPYRRADARLDRLDRGHGRAKGPNAGDLLLTIEAMKMETGLHADREAMVKAVHVQPGAQIDAKDLLVELEPDLLRQFPRALHFPSCGRCPVFIHHPSSNRCGRSSGVEHNLAKVRVVSSNLIARSSWDKRPGQGRLRAAFPVSDGGVKHLAVLPLRQIRRTCRQGP